MKRRAIKSRIKNFQAKLTSVWKRISDHPYLSISLALIILVLSFIVYQRLILGYTQWAEWTGLGSYTGPLSKDQRGKTLWDWLELIIVPAILAFGIYYLNSQNRERELEAQTKRSDDEKQLDIDKNREAWLQSYLDKITELLLAHNLRSSTNEDEVRSVARARTLTTLRNLDAHRKGLLLQFLADTNLINAKNPIISMENMDLTAANLSYAKLNDISLAGANLQESDLLCANLANADLSNTNLSSCDLRYAKLTRCNLRKSLIARALLIGADLTLADLSESDLSEADLSSTTLRSTKFKAANIHKTSFHDAEIVSTDLSAAKDLNTGLSSKLLQAVLDLQAHNRQ
jgi:uncharacterized protein YjbI with pentapeptide repeats